METDLNMKDDDNYDDYGSDDEGLELTQSKTLVVSESQLEGIHLSLCTDMFIVSTPSSYPIRVRISTLNTDLLPIPCSSQRRRIVMYTNAALTRY